MITGTATSVEAAITWPQSVARVALACTKPRSHSGKVRYSSFWRMTRATVNSFQACKKAYTPDATSPGASSGKVIRKKAWVRLRPVSYTHLTLPTNREV